MGSLNQNVDWLLQIYQSPRSVFGLADIALLTDESDPISLTKKLHYQVGKGNLKNPRKGLYTKPNYDSAALACTLYTPSYLSLDYVLQKEGVIFQYDSTITAVSYLSRAIEIDGWNIKYRKIKDAVLFNTTGIISNPNGINIASKERAFLDMLYLNGAMYFDSINTLNKKTVLDLLPIYESGVLEKRVKKMLKI
ncbi:MAG: hypothetical protein Q8S41_03745 [Lutibacter sp.]|nr:hypothetical protein [Lutibacter sp.]